MINNRYSILYKLGEGRSKVFCCEDKNYPGQKFAIKILGTSENTEIEMFQNEYSTLMKLNHPNIIKVFAAGSALYDDQNEFTTFEIDPGSRFYVMEHFDGQRITDADWIKNEQCLRLIILQICSVLFYLHNSNYVYCDLKLENILVRSNDDNIEIKFIDFGLSFNITEKKHRQTAGTFHYLAPEVLQGKDADFQSDLFSLGVLLYRLIYARFPFEGETESEILKSIINDEPVFSPANYSELTIGIVKKLLLKETDKRYRSAQEIIKEVNDIDYTQILQQWSPAKVIVDTSEKNQIAAYLNEDTRSEVLILEGTEGCGKTTLLEALSSENEELIYINHTENIITEKKLLELLLFHPSVYKHIEKETFQLALSFINENTPGADIFHASKSVLIKLSSEIPLRIVLDDFNRYEIKTKVFLIELVQIFQSKKSKVIIACDSIDRTIEESIYNFSTIRLQPFNKQQIDQLLSKSIPYFFPVKDIRRLLNDYWDLTPGGIYNFIKSLFENEAFEINSGRAILKEGYQVHGIEENYELILKTLSFNEKRLLELNSLLYRNIQGITCAEILRISKEEINLLIGRLQYKGILNLQPENGEISFQSDRFRQYVYSRIDNKDVMHVYVAEYLERTGKNIYNDEIAFQYEMSGNFEKSFEVLWETILLKENKDALRYQKEVLLKLSQFPVVKEKQFKARLQLCKVLQRLNEYRLCFDLIKEYQTADQHYKDSSDFVILSGICMIETGESENGKALLEKMITQLTLKSDILSSLLYLAYAYLDLGLFEQALEKCGKLIINSEEDPEYSAKGHNLLGLIDLQYKNDLNKALDEFKSALDLFIRAELLVNVAAAELNIGNIYSMMGNLDQAEHHWKNSLSINSSIGNLNQEAKLLLNLGIFYFDKSEFATALKYYNDALFIFSNIGDIFSAGLTNTNLGEINLSISRYTDAFRALMRAKEIFSGLNNISELIEIEFLIGKYYFGIGDSKGISVSKRNLENMINKDISNPKYSGYVTFLEIAKEILSGIHSDSLENLKSIKEIFYAESDWNDFILVALLRTELLIQRGCYSEALKELNDERLNELIVSRIYAKAEREILLSRITTREKDFGLTNKFEFLNNAYSLIEDQEINDLTWKLLYYIAEGYFERGNLNKALAMANYAEKSLIFIANNIEDDLIRKKYLSLPERKKVLQRIKYIQRQV